MTWGEAQSVIQLVVALNAIYLGLRDIRNPYVRREQDALAEQTRAWTQKLTTELGQLINDNQVLFTEKVSNFESRDVTIGYSCLLTVTIYVVLLIVSAFDYGSTISSPWHIVICILGFLPITFGVLLNIGLVFDLSRTVAIQRDVIDKKFAALRLSANANPKAKVEP